MIDMKMSKKESNANRLGTMPPDSPQGPEYPWGLSITLEEESLKKLGLTFADFKRGEKVSLNAEVEVQSRSESEDSDGKVRSSVSLQIQKMEVGKKGAKHSEYNRKKNAMGGTI